MATPIYLLTIIIVFKSANCQAGRHALEVFLSLTQLTVGRTNNTAIYIYTNVHMLHPQHVQQFIKKKVPIC